MYAHVDVAAQQSKLEEPLFAVQVGRPCSSVRHTELFCALKMWADEYLQGENAAADPKGLQRW